MYLHFYSSYLHYLKRAKCDKALSTVEVCEWWEKWNTAQETMERDNEATWNCWN